MRRVVCRDPRPNFEDPATQSFDFEFLPGGSIQIIAESDEHLVSQPMQEKSKLVGQESMTAQPIHTQMVLKSLDEVLRLSSIGVVIIKGLGREIVSVGDHKATIDPPMVDFHFDDDATESIPAAGSIKKLVKLTLFFLELVEPESRRPRASARPSVAGGGSGLTQ